MGIVEKVETLEKAVETNNQRITLQDERMFGKNGVSSNLEQLREDVSSLKRAAWSVALLILMASLGFGFAVLQLAHP